MREAIRTIKRRFFLSLAISAIALICSFLVYRISEYIPFFELVWLFGVLFVMFGISVVASVTCFAKIRQIRFYAALPFLANAATILLLVYVPFQWLWVQADFAWHRTEREKIVTSIYSGELKPNVPDNPSLIYLGPRFPTLSLGGNEIVVEEHSGKRFILFYTDRGMLDHYSGFLHVDEGVKPTELNLVQGGLSIESVAMDKQWYYISR